MKKIVNNLSKEELVNLMAEMPNLPNEKILTYKIYGYLKNNCVGYENRIKSDVLIKEFNITDNKTLRDYIQEIRESETLQKIVCSEAGKNGGYWIAENEEEVEKTLQHLYNRSMEMLKNYSIIRRKAKLDRQMRIKMHKWEKNIVESIVRRK